MTIIVIGVFFTNAKTPNIALVKDLTQAVAAHFVLPILTWRSISDNPTQKHHEEDDLYENLASVRYASVKGKLQNPLKEGFARLNIDAQSKRGCAVAAGYLIKLGTGK